MPAHCRWCRRSPEWERHGRGACRECYLVVDALAKLRTPTPEAAPLLLSVMAHLAQGLELRPLRPALHLNLLSTPPSQLIKLASAIKVRPRGRSRAACSSAHRQYTPRRGAAALLYTQPEQSVVLPSAGASAHACRALCRRHTAW